MADNYDITGQRPSSRVSPDMRIEDTYTVSFRTKPSGYVGVVQVPVGQYNPDYVHQLVDAQARNLEAIGNL